eukprot:12895804-Alexandrium_andersonii.AAC.1
MARVSCAGSCRLSSATSSSRSSRTRRACPSTRSRRPSCTTSPPWTCGRPTKLAWTASTP